MVKIHQDVYIRREHGVETDSESLGMGYPCLGKQTLDVSRLIASL